jgi:hypothetical protein
MATPHGSFAQFTPAPRRGTGVRPDQQDFHVMNSSTLGRICIALALACSHCTPLPVQQSAPRSPGARAQVMVLGTYHMGGSIDFVQTATDDVLSPRRQNEIESLVHFLATFRPTKIMVEVPLASDSALNARFRRYAAGQDSLQRDEVDQIGFRLAKLLGHSQLYAIDYLQDEDVGSVVQWAAQHGDTAFVRIVGAFVARKQAQADSLSSLTMAEHLRRLNSPDEDALGQSAYLRMARVGRDSTYEGADVVAGRYARNLKIFANLARLAEPGDRVLVIYGASHGKLLRDFVRESSDLELLEIWDDRVR